MVAAQLLDPEVPLEVVLTRLLAASAPSLAAMAAATKRKQLRQRLRKMHHDSSHRKHHTRREKHNSAGASAAGPLTKQEAAAAAAEDAVDEVSSQDEAQETAAEAGPSATAPASHPAAGQAAPSGSEAILPLAAPTAGSSASQRFVQRFGREARPAGGPEADGSSSRSRPSSMRRPKLGRSSKSSLKLGRKSGAIADEDAEDLCKICYDRSVEFQVAGCDHAVCYKCAKLICRKGVRDCPACPFCRREIEGFGRCASTS